MDPKDRRLILVIVLAVVAWVGVDYFLSPKPAVFVLAGSERSVYQAAAREAAPGVALPEAIDPSKFLPEIEVRKVANTVYEKPYEELFARGESRERLLSLVRREPVIELSGTNDPTVLKREGGSFNVSLRVKAYEGPVYGMRVEFLCPRGWEYIPGTVTDRLTDAEDVMTKKLASLEDRVQWAAAGKVLTRYATEKVVEPTARVAGDPARLKLDWSFARGLAEDQSMYLEFPLQTTGAQLPGEQEFVVKVTATDRPGKAGEPEGHALYAEMVLKVEITDEEALLGRTQPAFRDWDSLLLTSGGIPGSSPGSAAAKCCSSIGKGYRQPLSGVGF